ncbi:hypothetical protein HPP92_024507 [Vanilla planifolia]|uniref:RWP-RK domain-containing protein n=1 Tax=Vanilla planifolia TaxID=51239 RepID=A0A835PN49_VANPL|nr:hypothetical protein HPP92_024782 [Vanilla planifolia]KAG0456719.1 hypothetical protein HPP92_024507 [Vanilla planifolia]
MPPEDRSAEEGAANWVPPGAELDCSDCVVLREVVHSDGLKNMRLRIHGNVGKFYHATLDVNYNVDGFPPAMEQAYIDLSKQSFEWVKKFLIDYAFLRHRDKYALEHDSVSAFFDALCVRMSYDGEPSTSQGKFHLSFGTGLCQAKPASYNDGANRTSKTGIAAQRERTGKLHIKDLADYFHLPISEAAKELRICSTALKKICRKHGMSRWPHRKIKSIDRRISNLLRDLRTDNEQEKANAQAEIESLRAQRARICAGLPP